MNKTTSYELDNRITITTPELQKMLGVGRPAATKIGNDAKARFESGGRVLWNAARIKEYVDSKSISKEAAQ